MSIYLNKSFSPVFLSLLLSPLDGTESCPGFSPNYVEYLPLPKEHKHS